MQVPLGSLLEQILQHGVVGQLPPLTSLWQQLACEALADPLRAKAFGITAENVFDVIWARLQLLQSVYPARREFCQTTSQLPPDQQLETLWKLWLPLAMQVASHYQTRNRPFIQGILGGQGTGKTTLAAILTSILNQMGYRTLSLSLDDLYKTYLERLTLRERDPRLVWRGPPGTHDIRLGLTLLDRLRQGGETIQVPRFDKSAWGGAGDRRAPEVIQGADIVLFEGWFVGLRPIDSTVFESAELPHIQSAADRAFARDMNTELENYLPLWERLDRLILLYPADYRLTQQWRKEAEQRTRVARNSGMTDAEVEKFVEYFWRALHPELFIKPLLKKPSYVDLVIEIHAARSIGAVYQPNDRLE
jgi:D-glycerate 3-kinase